MKISNDVEDFQWGLGNMEGESRTIFLLEGGRGFKVSNDLLEKIRDCLSPFIGGGECFHPP